MKRKMILTCMLAALMSAFMLASCSDGSSDDDDEETTTSSSSSSSDMTIVGYSYMTFTDSKVTLYRSNDEGSGYVKERECGYSVSGSTIMFEGGSAAAINSDGSITLGESGGTGTIEGGLAGKTFVADYDTRDVSSISIYRKKDSAPSKPSVKPN